MPTGNNEREREREGRGNIPFLFECKLQHLYSSHKVTHQIIVTFSLALKESYFTLTMKMKNRERQEEGHSPISDLEII